jgi:hypothetical protein
LGFDSWGFLRLGWGLGWFYLSFLGFRLGLFSFALNRLGSLFGNWLFFFFFLIFEIFFFILIEFSIELILTKGKISILIGFIKSNNMKSSITLDNKCQLINKRDKEIDSSLWSVFGQ